MEGVQTRNGLYGFEFRDVDQRRVEDRKNYDIKQLWQRSHEIINLAAQGFKNTDIAEILGITPATVSNTLNGELGQKKLSEIRQSRDEDARKNSEKIRILTAKAIQVYHEIFDNEDGQATLKDRKEVADTVVLELSGLRAPTKTQNFNVSTVLTPDEINSFKERGLRAARDAKMDNIIDVTDRDESFASPINEVITTSDRGTRESSAGTPSDVLEVKGMNLIHKQKEVKLIIERLAIQLGVDPTWATAIAMVESSLGVHQKSSTGCVGVFQMSSIAMKDLHQEMAKVDDELVDITCGLLFLRLLLKRHKSIEAATSAYCDPKDRPFYLDKVRSYMKAFEPKSD